MMRDPAESLLGDVCVATLCLCGRHPVIRKVGAQLRVRNSDRTDFIKGLENTRIHCLYGKGEAAMSIWMEFIMRPSALQMRTTHPSEMFKFCQIILPQIPKQSILHSHLPNHLNLNYVPSRTLASLRMDLSLLYL